MDDLPEERVTSPTAASHGAALAVRRHASLRLFAEVMGRGLHWGLVYVAQRVLGPVLYGHFTWALALGFVLSSVTSLGMPLIVTREIARRPSDGARVAGAGLAFKLVLAAGAAGALGVAALTRPAGVQLSTFIVGLAAVAISFVEFIGHVFRGLQRVHHETALLLLLRVTALVFGGWALWSGLGLIGFASAYLVSATVTLLLGWAWLSWRFFVPRLSLDRFARTHVLQASLPLGGATILSVAYTRTAVFVLDLVRGPAAVGIYGVAQKLTEPLAVVPYAVMAAVFPVISRDNQTAGKRMPPVLATSLKVVAGAGAVLAAAGVAFGPWVIRTLYPEDFQDASAVLQVLAVSVLPVFVNYILTHVLIAADRQHLNFVFSAVVFVANALLCLLLTPGAGATGAALAVLISEVLLLGLCWIAIGGSASRPLPPGAPGDALR